MKLPSQARFADDVLKTRYLELEKTNPLLHNSLRRTFNVIEEDAFSGIQIPKRLIPADYTHNVRNLWKYNLIDGWRLLYSIATDNSAPITLVIDWLSHKEYERKFKY